MEQMRWKDVVSPGECYHIARTHMRGRLAFRLHTHDFSEIFWIETGQGVHAINGERVRLAAGDLITVRPADAHGFSAVDKDGFILVNAAFPTETIKFLGQRYFPKEARFFWSKEKQPSQIRLSAAQQRKLRNWADDLGRAPRSRLEIDRFLMELFRDLSAQSVPPPASTVPDWLTRALEQIRDPQHFVLGTPELARLAAHTPQHVNAMLRRHFDQTATDAVNQARLDHAALQLRMSTKKIVEICFECGFQNLGHFYKVFRQQFNATPRQYRQRHSMPVR